MHSAHFHRVEVFEVGQLSKSFQETRTLLVTDCALKLPQSPPKAPAGTGFVCSKPSQWTTFNWGWVSTLESDRWRKVIQHYMQPSFSKETEGVRV